MKLANREIFSILSVGFALAALPLVMVADLPAAFASLQPREKLYACGLAFTAFLWLASRYWELAQQANERNRKSRLALEAIFAEVIYNVNDLRNFQKKGNATKGAVHKALASSQVERVHFTDARHTLIYRSALDDLRLFDVVSVGKIVAFYAELERIKNQVDSIQLESFTSIFGKGRAQYIDYVWDTIAEAIDLGDAVTQDFLQRHPDLRDAHASMSDENWIRP